MAGIRKGEAEIGRDDCVISADLLEGMDVVDGGRRPEINIAGQTVKRQQPVAGLTQFPRTTKPEIASRGLERVPVPVRHANLVRFENN